MSDVSPLSGISGLSFDSTLLLPVLFFCLVLLPFLSYLFFCLLVLSSELYPENSSIFFVKRQAFLYDSCLAARRSKLVGFFLILFFYCFYLFFFYTFFLKSGIDKSTEWSTTSACPSFMRFFNRVGTRGTNSWKISCSMFVYDLLYVNLCTGLILWFLNNMWFVDLRTE